MGKYFEVVYSPSVWGGGYGGLYTQAPENLIAPQFSPALDNVILRNSEVRSRPHFNNGYLPPPVGTGGVLGSALSIGSFFSHAGQWHTFVFAYNISASVGLHELQTGSAAITATGGNPWTMVYNPTELSADPVNWWPFRGVLYFTTGGTITLSWDGTDNGAGSIKQAAFAGAAPVGTTFGSRFLGSLSDHLILAYTYEAGTTYPQRVRWSNIGFDPYGAGTFGSNLGTAGATFDPAISVNAGLADFLEVADQITGMMFMGRVAYILRTNGITEMIPTGQGQAPFAFNHLWASKNGIGNLYPWGNAQYGNLGVIISTEQIYKLGPSSISPIGGGARDAIMNDLARMPSLSPSQGTYVTGPRAVICPQLSYGFTYLTYMLFIPTSTGTRVWVYSFEDNNWTRWTLPNVILTGVPNVAYTANPVVTVPSGGGGASPKIPPFHGGGTFS